MSFTLLTASQHHVEPSSPPSRATAPEILFLGQPHSDLFAEVLLLNSSYLPLYDLQAMNDLDKAAVWLLNRSELSLSLPKVILCDLALLELNKFEILHTVHQYSSLALIPFVVLSPQGKCLDNHEQALRLGIDDCYAAPFNHSDIGNRLMFLQQFKKVRSTRIVAPEKTFSTHQLWWKRVFDVAVSLTALLLLSPLLLLIAACIKWESDGPVIYRSKRVGTGYKVFDFLKFRSMRAGADAEVLALQHLNQYSQQTDDDQPSFFKVANDPRITRIGRFIRNTSLDELPQLINVLRGDMSIVGNRPLPLYEAEQLTRDVWAKRFLAPAGLTGLWQVSKRGSTEMSALERIELDNTYAEKCSFLFDMQIILKTIPAMFQHESV